MADDAEGEDPGGGLVGRVAAVIAPVDDHGVRIEAARISEADAQCRRAALVDGRGVEAQLEIGRRDILDRDTSVAGTTGAMVVGHRSRDGIGATTDGLVQVLVAYAAETQDSP